MSVNELRPKERMKIPRQAMPEQPAEERRGNFREVNQGLTVLVLPPKRCAAWSVRSPTARGAAR